MAKMALLRTLILVAVASVPVVFFAAPDYWKAVRKEWLPARDAEAIAGPDQASSADGSTQEVPVPGTPAAILLEGAPVRELAEVLRFDVSTGWIMQRWPRVSTGLAQPKLQGYRVPLVTGTAKTDLAGSLTYYFNPSQQVQRITFHGTTGDSRELVRLLTTRYRFTRRITNDPGLFLYEAAHADGRPKSTLQIRSAQVVKASNPHRRFEVELVMERPKG